MRVTIDSDNKIIQIEKASADEVKKLAEDYPDYLFESRYVNYNYYPQWGTSSGTLITNNL